MQPLPPGTWPSPISAAHAAADDISYGPVAVTDGGRTVWWAESRPAEGGRVTVLRRTDDGPAEEVLAAQLNARTRVHEYGGLCWTVVGDELVTSNFGDQRLYRGDQPLTPETGSSDRYAEPLVLPGGSHVLCVREVAAEAVTHELVAVPLDGAAADARDEVVVLWQGSDFVSSARLAPDGASLAFVTWDHPSMPWDSTELRVATLDGLALRDVRVVLDRMAVQQPLWQPDGSLWAIGEVDGWWNVVRADGSAVWADDEECVVPTWLLGFRTAVPVDGGLAVGHGRDEQRLSVVTASGVTPVDLPFVTWSPWLASDGSTVVGICSTATTHSAVVAVDVTTGLPREIAGPEQPDPAWAPNPEVVTVPSAAGRVAHAQLYPPTSPDADLPDGVAPPYVLWVHGGPTSQSRLQYDVGKAYFTSRGIGIVDVNYGGSTGYGRAYRDALRGQWGVVDVEDCEAVARWLLDTGRASAVAIQGGSAGGWTVLAALTRGGSVFAAGTSYFGVVDLLPFAETTHDFESRYLDGLIGPLPEAHDVYVERSPLTHVDRLDRPLLVLQGLDDPVVPPAQAEVLVKALQDKGIPHAYLPFEGEAHGFRKAENIAASLEAELSFYGQVLGFDPPDVPVLPLIAG
jgi:fermentation-respiration switch protein FrsA (DUF1100 family)